MTSLLLESHIADRTKVRSLHPRYGLRLRWYWNNLQQCFLLSRVLAMSFDLFHRCLVSPLAGAFVHAYTAVLLSVDALLVM